MAQLLNEHLYGALADEYATHSESSGYNAHYERPAMLELLGDVRGKSILDIGCGGAPLLRILANRGARKLVGIEGSRRLAEIARTRVPDDVTIYNGEVHEVLAALASADLPDANSDNARFDCVIASLVLHYIDPLEPLLRLIASVLADRGRLLISTNIPERKTSSTYIVEERWSTFNLDVARYERSEENIRNCLGAAGFDAIRTITPPPLPTMRDIDPRGYARVCMQPAFLFIEARLRSPAPSV
ncbi:MAG TPA: class I SAM-dependent methyltransferase [Candidatus Tumulicola sp.]